MNKFRLSLRGGISLMALFIGVVAFMIYIQKGYSSDAELEEQFKKLLPLKTRLADNGLKIGDPVFIRIFKKEAKLELWMQPKEATHFILFHTYPICTFSGTLGPKQKEGDRQAPEGFYFVTKNQLNPRSRFKKAFNLGYPNAYDQQMGYTGSYLMVHGDCVSIGCYAMTDSQIEEIYLLVESALTAGQPFFRVHALPFHLTDANLKNEINHPWYEFWKMLQPGYLYFEQHLIPPNIKVVNKQYYVEQ